MSRASTTRTWLVVAGCVALGAGAGWYAHRALTAAPGGSGTAPPVPPLQRVQTVNGETVVIVPADVQRASHIEVATLGVATARPERIAYATVIDLQRLFDLRNRLAAARADRDSARAQADASRAQYARDRALFEDDRNVSKKTLQDTGAVMQADAARLQSADAAREGIEAMLRQQFGDALAAAATTPASDLVRRLSRGRAVVLRVTLPADYRAPAPVRITVDGADGRPIAAQRLSASPQGDPAVQGRPYLYLAERALPIGTRLAAHLPLDQPSAPGLLIPESAIVWYGGQPWVYVKTAVDRFTRRYVPRALADDRGFVVTAGFQAGEAVVVRGAQLLLSEELRPQGVSTQCKDPPECDG
ncbi:MAG: efflux RND transporter periplasmic adaptor subunit [Betaproteobacteria bacterium]|nr:efflux RND transporter periplasmic adaptor subunit [Betaproteobacteria bacterium]